MALPLLDLSELPQVRAEQGQAVKSQMQMIRIALGESDRAESKLLSRYQGCTLDLDQVLRNLYTLETSLIDLVHERFYDPTVMSAVSCILSVLNTNSDGVEAEQKIVEYFKHIKVLNEGVEGVVLEAGQRSGLFVFKYPKYEGNLVHEALAGLYALNPLRAQIPNFGYVYGYFSCGIGVRTDRQVWICSRSRSVEYIAMENIVDIPSLEVSQSLESLIPSLSGPEFVLIYLQVILALQVAYEKCQFTHYDLHAGNVLIKMLPEAKSITFPLAGGDVTIVTRQLAVIIDYSFAHFVHDGIGYGVYTPNINELGIINAPHPAIDAWKLLISSFQNANGAHLEQFCSRLFLFFTDLSIEKVKNTEMYYGIVARTEATLAYRHTDLINYILDNYYNSEPAPVEYSSLNCKSLHNCLTNDDISTRFLEKEPRDVWQVYLLAVSTKDINKRVSLAKLIKGQDFQNTYDRYVEDFNNLVSKIQQDIQYLLELPITDTVSTYEEARDELDKYRDYSDRIVSVLSGNDKLVRMNQAYTYLDRLVPLRAIQIPRTVFVGVKKLVTKTNRYTDRMLDIRDSARSYAEQRKDPKFSQLVKDIDNIVLPVLE